MAPKNRPNIWLVIWVSLAILLYLPFIAVLVLNIVNNSAHPNTVWIGDGQLLPEAYFAMFWFSGLLLWRHFMAAIGFPSPPSAWLEHTLHTHIAVQSPFHLTWLYPPTMGLLSLLYAALPLHLSFWVWRGLYLAISAFALRRAGLAWPPLLIGLLGPAAVIDTVEGENGMLTGGLAAASLLLLETRPRLAGCFISILTIKPQTGLIFPFIVLQPRLRAALLSAILGCVFLICLTLPFFGIDGWLDFVSHSPHASSSLEATSFNALFPEAGATFFYMLRSYGLATAAAFYTQAIVSMTVSILLWRLWRIPDRPNVPRMAASLSLGALLMPYGYLYDLVGFSIGMMAMCFHTTSRRKPVYAALWLFAGHSATIAGLTGHILMPVAALIGAVMSWLEAAPRTLPHDHSRA